MKASIQPIICGTDFSVCATEAGDVAAHVARKLETKLILVHSNQIHGLDAMSRETIVTESRQKLNAAIERLRKLGTKAEGHLFPGSAVDTIVDVAEQSNARLVVLGAVGHGVGRRLLIGSVAERVAETSPVPTLIVRPKSRLLSWLRGERELKVLLGHDFSATGDAALQWINDADVLGKIAVTVIHIHSPDEQNRTKQELFDRTAKILRSQKFAVGLVPCWGNCEGALFEEAAREDADLVVVGTHQRRGIEHMRLGSVSRALLHHATRSVAVVPPATGP